MSRPVARMLEGPPPATWGPLEAPPPEPHGLDGLLITGVVADQRSAAAALDVALRGGELAVHVRLDGVKREDFLDQLARIADVQHAGDTLPADEAALLRHLRAGASLQEAARGSGMSRRTAARRLAGLRRRYGVQTVAELVAAARR